MIPPKLGDVWILKILIVVEKVSHHAILDLVSSINILSIELYDLLDPTNSIFSLFTCT
jgi:hypothetical protein